MLATIVCWCRMKASRHNLHGVIDDRVNEAGLRNTGTKQECSYLILNGPRQMFTMLSKHPNLSHHKTAMLDASFLQSDSRCW